MKVKGCMRIKRMHNPKFQNKVHSQGDYRGLPGAVPCQGHPNYDSFVENHSKIDAYLALQRQLRFDQCGEYFVRSESLFSLEEIEIKMKLQEEFVEYDDDDGEPA